MCLICTVNFVVVVFGVLRVVIPNCSILLKNKKKLENLDFLICFLYFEDVVKDALFVCCLCVCVLVFFAAVCCICVSYGFSDLGYE